MPARIEAYEGNEQSAIVKYLFPGEIAAIDLGRGLVTNNVLLIGCDREDSCVELFEAPVPEGCSLEPEDIEELHSLCTSENQISPPLKGDDTQLSYGGQEYAALILNIEHFYSMTIN